MVVVVFFSKETKIVIKLCQKDFFDFEWIIDFEKEKKFNQILTGTKLFELHFEVEWNLREREHSSVNFFF